MKKNVYEAPTLSTVALQVSDVLLASEGGLTEAGVADLSGNGLVFRKDGSVNVWG